jgi:hypothetical protein
MLANAVHHGDLSLISRAWNPRDSSALLSLQVNGASHTGETLVLESGGSKGGPMTPCGHDMSQKQKSLIEQVAPPTRISMPL